MQLADGREKRAKPALEHLRSSNGFPNYPPWITSPLASTTRGLPGSPRVPARVSQPPRGGPRPIGP